MKKEERSDNWGAVFGAIGALIGLVQLGWAGALAGWVGGFWLGSAIGTWTE